MRIFGTDRIKGLMGKLGMEEGEPIESGMVSRAIERAQKQVEARNFEMRKHLLEYDDVMNKQREAIYRLRRDILDGKEGRDYVVGIAKEVVAYLVDTHCPAKDDARDWNLSELATDMLAYFDIQIHGGDVKLEDLDVEELREHLQSLVEGRYSGKEARLGSDLMRLFEKDIMLRIVDQAWKDHLLALDHLKEGIGLRGYGQRDPKNEYKKESYELFTGMKERIEDSALKTLFRLEPISPEQIEERTRQRAAAAARPRFQMETGAAAAAAVAPPSPFAPRQAGPPQPAKPQTVVRQGDKVGRNDPCPCGSGKKFKKCHGAATPVTT
jgi:preprotein translocase subunit SecA